MSELQASRFFSRPEPIPQHNPTKIAKPVAKTAVVKQVTTQKLTHLSKDLSKSLSTDAIESLTFELRKIPKTRVNADIPNEWKERLDDLAHELRVGKYELILYIIGVYLGKIKSPDN